MRTNSNRTEIKDIKARRPRQARLNRDRALTLRCTAEERGAIERRAAAAGLPLSEFVRVSAQTTSIRSRADLDAVAEIAKIAGDLGRLGGLLKLWLTERRGDGASAVEVDQVLAKVRDVVEVLADKAAAL